MHYAKRVLPIFFAFLIVGCSSAETPTEPPQAAYVGTTPAYETWVKEFVQAYWDIEPDNGIIPQVHPLEQNLIFLDDGEIEMVIAASSDVDGWFATPLFTDAIAVLIHPELELSELSLDELYDIFFGSVDRWTTITGDDLMIQQIIPIEGDEIREAFQKDVLKGSRFTSNALLAPHPEAALALLESEPGAIAIVPRSALPAGQTALLIEGVQLSPSTIESDRYPLTLEVNAIAPEEPTGAMRRFLGWLQAQLNPSS